MGSCSCMSLNLPQLLLCGSEYMYYVTKDCNGKITLDLVCKVSNNQFIMLQGLI